MVNGVKEKFKIPEGTQTDTKFRIKGKGFKSANSSTYGDFIFNVIVKVPRHLSKETKGERLSSWLTDKGGSPNKRLTP